ncbi:YitT family protein [Flavobacteriales bacterium]|nr:YitT family protein [Flavobacteriales bacterium]
MNRSRKIMNLVNEYVQIFIGIILASIGLKAFLLPNGFLDGGATGIAILLSEEFPINISLILIFVSIPFLIMAWYTVSKKVFLKSICSIIGLAIFIHFENFQSITDDKLLIAIFGGLFLGAGIGLAIKNGSVLDGSEILGIYVNEKYGISIGKTILIFNVFLFGITAFLLSVEIAMYSVLTYLITSVVIDFVIKGFENYVGIMIVSKKSKDIQELLVKDIKTGITVYKGSHGIGNSGIQKDMDIIHIIIHIIDIRKTFNLIDSVDQSAFVTEFDVNHVKGGIKRRTLLN